MSHSSATRELPRDVTRRDIAADDIDTRDITVHPDVAPWMLRALWLNDVLRGVVDRVGRGGSWLILPVVFITMLDAVSRKLPAMQYWLVHNVSPYFGSTILQELEWHFHTGLFALVLGYGFIYNAHVRVDLVRERLSFRSKARLEFWGLTFFMIPFCSIIIWFAADWVIISYNLGEISASQVGIPHRWVIKTVLLIGLIVALISGIAVWLQMLVVLWGPQDARFDLSTLEWPEEDAKIEGKERLQLDYSLSEEVMADVSGDDGSREARGTKEDRAGT